MVFKQCLYNICIQEKHIHLVYSNSNNRLLIIVKRLKIRTPEQFAVVTLKLEPGGFTIGDIDRMANSVNPDQTPPSLIWIYIFSGLSVQNVRNIMVSAR